MEMRPSRRALLTTLLLTGAGTVPASGRAPRGPVTSLRLGNIAGSAASAPIVSYVQGFARGDVPGASGSAIGLTVAGAIAQQDGETFYSDGSLKTAILTVQVPGIAAGATTPPMPIGFAARGPNRAPVVSLPQLAASSDIRIVLTDIPGGKDLGGVPLELRVNDVIRDGTGFPWGPNPVQGYYATASGPLKAGWCFWAFAKDFASGARHKWLKIKVWVDAFSPGRFAVRARVVQDTVFGGLPACVLGATPQPAHLFLAALTNKATLLQQWGGASDRRVFALPGSAFDPATQRVTVGEARPPLLAPFILTAGNGGTLPRGLATNTVYYSYEAPAARDTMKLLASRALTVIGYSQGIWTGGAGTNGTANGSAMFSDTGFNRFDAKFAKQTIRIAGGAGFAPGVFTIDRVIDSATVMLDRSPGTGSGAVWGIGYFNKLGGYIETSNGAYYTNTFATKYNAATTGLATVAPSGPGPVGDGTLVWNCLSAGPFTSAGSGTIQFVPVLKTHPSGGVELTDMTSGERIWIGGTPPSVHAVPELSYYTGRANLTPPFNLDVRISPLQAAPLPWPGALSPLGIDLNQSGNGAGDERIGPINHSAARALLRPLDRNQRRMAAFLANAFTDYHIHIADESSGLQPIANNGPAKNGVPYANIPRLRPGLRPFPGPSAGVASPSVAYRDLDGYYERYGTWADSSHLPMLAYGPYLQSGDDAYLDQTIGLFAMMESGIHNPTQIVKSETFYLVSNMIPGSSGRGSGWATRVLGNLHALLPQTRPDRQYVTDIYNDNANYAVAVFPTMPAKQQATGAWNAGDGGPLSQPWQQDFRFQMWAQEAIRGDNPNWAVAARYLVPFTIGRMDEAGSGSEYYASVRYLYNYAGNTGKVADLLPDFPDVFLNTFKTFGPGNIIGNGAPDPYVRGLRPAVSMFNEMNNGPEPWRSTSLGQFAANSALMGARLGIPRCAAILSNLNARLQQGNGGNPVLANLAEYPEIAWSLP